MKVLFAVSNEEISESIVKKYQKEYKQIISYKNVYYFNAILKELQKDKTYDRIVISEELETFTHTQYDQIDKFIFDKLDSISDEASNIKGNDIPIILICSDRRTKSESILVKLFGIGIYNAVIGNDRSVDEVCRLINRPRVKKEAKVYYKIDVDDVKYQAENENDVSEMEIQNIIAHYKRLGKNEERYIESFNNIAAQYNDTQLKIISKCLPLNVRAVLEEKSPKYQQIMAYNNSVSDKLRYTKEDKNQGPSEKLLTLKNKGVKMTNPVVIPSSVNMHSNIKLAKPKVVPEQKTDEQEETKQQIYNGQVPQVKQYNDTKQDIEEEKEISDMAQEILNGIDIPEEPETKPIKRGRGRPRKNPLPSTQEQGEKPVKRGRGRPRKNPQPEEIEKVEDNIFEQSNILPEVEEPEESNILPGFEDIEENDILSGFEDIPEEDTSISDKDSTYEDSAVLPGFEDVEEDKEDIPSFEDKPEESSVLPGFENITNTEYNNQQQYSHYDSPINPILENANQGEIDLARLLTSDKKIATFVGTSKNGTSFIVNNLAELISSTGVNTAILDTTQNRNAYYIYTKNEEQLREIATRSIQGLAQGQARGIEVNKNLTVYTSLPDGEDDINNVDKILETLLQKHSLILIDTDFSSPVGYFKEAQEIYLVQTLDVLTIQPLTAFLRDLKAKNVLDQKKLKIVLNKNVKIRGVSDKTIIGGMAYYNDPAMSYMTELFDRNLIKHVSIPFEEETYIKYLEGIIECNISLKGYSKYFIQALRELSNMVYTVYRPQIPNSGKKIVNDGFTPNMNRTLDQMKKNY